ncbi:MAG: hypothetical protein LBH98_08655 [Chitinispirillales bacterium]|nr:hypothetical protein [Chitinispirillales bacterium]
MRKIITIIIVFVIAAVAQDLRGIDFFHQVAKRSEIRGAKSFSPYSYDYVRTSQSDSVEIYAIRVEFKADSVNNTTGNGLFMRKDFDTHKVASNGVFSSNDAKEFRWYDDKNTYKYDKIPHDSTYFDHHLTALRNYFSDVSKSNIKIGFKIFPQGPFGAYKLGKEMALYSPGAKRKDETYDNFYLRISRAMMTFVAEAIVLADTSKFVRSPFNDLQMDDKGIIYKIDENSSKKIKVFILLIHAGSSALTDGGLNGISNANSPNDLTDAFINEEMFRYFNKPHENIFGNSVEKDEKSKKTGVKIFGKDSSKLILSELMMLSETANQDSLNWGINGILVNQFARQLGIPDLYSTSSGISGIGSFGIMDFAGYSAAQGFIPPNPSAFVRSFMGWDTPIHAKPDGKTYSVKAFSPKRDSTLFLIPINNTEYYLAENRQRNLSGRDLFSYDTIKNERYVSSGGFYVNLEKNADSISNRGVIMKVKSRDIGIPASGVCLWHIDEKLIKNRLEFNMLNSDSSYRAVNLVEADGITDIGVEFTDVLGYSAYDYGSAADVFPHTNVFKNGNQVISQINSKKPTPDSPTTTANDGGNSFLDLKFMNSEYANISMPERYYYSKTQNTKFDEYSVINYSDSIILMTVDLEKNEIAPKENFPVNIGGDFTQNVGNFYPLLTADITKKGGKEIVVLDKKGRLSIVSQNGDIIYQDSIDAVNMPTFTGNGLMIPCKNKIAVYNGVGGLFVKSEISDADISSHITELDSDDNVWVFGANDGKLIFGRQTNIIGESKSVDNSAITAVAKFDKNLAATVSKNGVVAVIGTDKILAEFDVFETAKIKKFPPFKIFTNGSDIIIADNKQGLWYLIFDGKEIKLNANQRNYPIDWAGIFRDETERENIPDNESHLSMADLDGDGTMELLVSGTNGIYAFDNKGNLFQNYPKFLDRAEWSIRKSVLAAPAAVSAKSGEKFVFFTTATGNNKSYYQTKATKIDTVKGTVYFEDIDKKLDSITGFSKGFIDSLRYLNDSLIFPYYAPGGLIDMRSERNSKSSNWTISVGHPLSQGVVIDDIDGKDTLNLIAISDNGMLYCYKLDKNIFDDSKQTNMVGMNAQRTFSAKDIGEQKTKTDDEIEYFYSYPNPLKIAKNSNASVTFRYKLGNAANSATLSIYTMQGQKVFESGNLLLSQGVNEFTLNDLSRFGSAVYRCRLSAKIGSKEKILFWKMAILR